VLWTQPTSGVDHPKVNVNLKGQMKMKRRILRRGLICAGIGFFAGLLFYGSSPDFTVQEAVLSGALFALASFVPMSVWPYVVSNFFGEKK